MWKKGLIAGGANLVVWFALNMGLSAVFPALTQEYQNPAMFRPWTDPLMMAFFAYPFVLGVVAAYLWDMVKSQLKGKTPTEKALSFAKLYFVIATVPGMFVTLTSFQVSYLMVLSWTLSGFAQIFVAGLVLAKVK